MTIENPNENIFYLGFNKKTGKMVEVVPPKGKELLFGPEQFNELNKVKLDLEKEQKEKALLKELIAKYEKIERVPFELLPLSEQISRVWVSIRENAIPEIKLIIADKSENSSCGGSCGGIPFWMCG